MKRLHSKEKNFYINNASAPVNIRSDAIITITWNYPEIYCLDFLFKSRKQITKKIIPYTVVIGVAIPT